MVPARSKRAPRATSTARSATHWPRSGLHTRQGSRPSRRTRERKRAARSPRCAPERQDELLTELEQNRATGFTPSSAAFFELVLGHTLEGTFGDPHYGGNQDFVGWELIGYPGLRLAVTAEQQRHGCGPRAAAQLGLRPRAVRRTHDGGRAP